jgi:hypothetical protein
MGIYMAVVYWVTKPFGAAAQGGFTIGLRIVQSAFLPVVALGFAVAPVAGQNFAARKGDRVRAAFRAAAGMSAGVMFIASVVIYFTAAPLMAIFTKDPEVTAVGVEYLRIVVLNFVASGVTFVSSSMFQALGNTIRRSRPSTLRILIAAIPAIFLARVAGFHLTWIWYLGAIAVLLQMTLNLILLQRELQLKLGGERNVGSSGGRRRYNHRRVKLAVPKECRPGERRVAVTPENVARIDQVGLCGGRRTRRRRRGLFSTMITSRRAPRSCRHAHHLADGRHPPESAAAGDASRRSACTKPT